MSQAINRRTFVATTAAAGAGLAMTGTCVAADKPALLGGAPVHTGGWPPWPEWRQSWEPQILEVCGAGDGIAATAAERCPSSRRLTPSC